MKPRCFGRQGEDVLRMEDEFMMDWLKKSAWSLPMRNGSEIVNCNDNFEVSGQPSYKRNRRD